MRYYQDTLMWRSDLSAIVSYKSFIVIIFKSEMYDNYKIQLLVQSFKGQQINVKNVKKKCAKSKGTV